MELSEEQLEQIENYLTGLLKGEELAVFEEKLKQADFKQEVEWYEAMMSGIKYATIIEKQEAEANNTFLTEEKKVETKRMSLSSFRLKTAAAATILLVLGVGMWYFYSADHEIIAAQKPVEITLDRTKIPLEELTLIKGEIQQEIPVDSLVCLTYINNKNQLEYTFEKGILEIFFADRDQVIQNDFLLVVLDDEVTSENYLKMEKAFYPVEKTKEKKSLQETLMPSLESYYHNRINQ